MATRRIATRIKDHPPHNDFLPDLRAPGLLAKQPAIGILMFIFGVLLFSGLAYNLLTRGPLLALDRELSNTLPAIALKSPAFIKYLMIAGFYIGTVAIIVFDSFLGLYFLIKRYWREFAMVMIGGTGSALLFYSLSAFFARPRPPNQIWNIVSAPSFPSGHTISTVVFCGLLAYLLVPKMPSVFWKVFVITATLVIMGLVGFSRVFTAGHYLTDVLAGFAVGIAWSGFAFTLIEVITQKRRKQDAAKE